MSKPTIKAALVLVNKARKVMFLKPLNKMPRGVISSGCDCPLSNALGLMVSRRYAVSYDRIEIMCMARAWETKTSREGHLLVANFPPLLIRFLKCFDNGEYPSLIKPKKDTA